MNFPPFSGAASNGDNQENNDDSTERTSLLSVLTRSVPVAGRSRFLIADNLSSYGSVAGGRNSIRRSNSSSNNNINNTERSDTIIVSNGDDDDTSVGDSSTSFSEGATYTIDIDIDIEEGEYRHRGRQRRRSDRTPLVETVQSDDNNDTPSDRERREGQQSSSETPGSEPSTEEQIPPQQPRDGAIGNITRRLRCLFSTITFPIVPLGTIVSLALLWVLYAATSLDLRKSCSHPLHSYALMSVLLVAYIPNHSQVRSQIFHYSRERDGPIRPARVRMYDQFFHTVCLLYVYTGVTLISTCREDIVDRNKYSSYDINIHGEASPLNACEATCPNLYQALSVYVATLELFTFALILPLLFLPCIYLWFLQRATAEADAFNRLQDRLQEEETILSNGGVTTGEILNSLDVVKIVSRKGKDAKKDDTTNSEIHGAVGDASCLSVQSPYGSNEQKQQEQLWVLPIAAPNDSIGTPCEAKECCICMSEFDQVQCTVVPTDGSDSGDTALVGSSDQDEDSDEDYSGSEHTTYSKNNYSQSKDLDHSDATIVRTRCNHLFHKECLKEWVGGMGNFNNYRTGDADRDQPDWRKRKARQIRCPLCREDLRPGSSATTSSAGATGV